jgi:hypothetical protein
MSPPRFLSFYSPPGHQGIYGAIYGYLSAWHEYADENDPVYKPRLSVFTQALADLGWTDRGNARIYCGRAVPSYMNVIGFGPPM